ncbi:hypothetical protein [Ureibacillus endophyticus]|uniref:Uncharacterized protein n=1 Tax=Ureibacillus endophyticus TaxID=1978490 RepID=A0A494YSN8_9BACL|nr:hypothetical protein [Lysinibacillus endophyticus]RKQ12985.1 hypothetical protein D8M03_16640 [Lysinibacillus endophyticus]
MTAEQRLSQVLTKKLGYYVPISAIGYETMSFYKEEIDPTLVPPHIIGHLADPINADSVHLAIKKCNKWSLILRPLANTIFTYFRILELRYR